MISACRASCAKVSRDVSGHVSASRRSAHCPFGQAKQLVSIAANGHWLFLLFICLARKLRFSERIPRNIVRHAVKKVAGVTTYAVQDALSTPVSFKGTMMSTVASLIKTRASGNKASDRKILLGFILIASSVRQCCTRTTCNCMHKHRQWHDWRWKQPNPAKSSGLWRPRSSLATSLTRKHHSLAFA